jgi:hypothetical protein
VLSDPGKNLDYWEDDVLQKYETARALLRKNVGGVVLALLSVLCSTASLSAAPCTGPGAPSTTETKCLTAVKIPGNAIRSFDISSVNSSLNLNQYYLSDRSNAGIDVVNAVSNTFTLRLTGFVGVVLSSSGTVNNTLSGPNGVTSHGVWVYGGDGNSTLKVFNLVSPPTVTSGVPGIAPAQSIFTGGMFRVDEMSLNPDGTFLLAANNVDDPPFATLFAANGDSAVSNVSIITKITVDPTIIPPGFGLSLEASTWEPTTQRFYNSIPIIANNPPGCNYGQLSGAITCDGGLLVIDPTTLSTPTAVLGAFDETTNTGVVPLHGCGPNGVTVGPNANLLLGCTPSNNPSDMITLVINAQTKNYSQIFGITGSDEVWFNPGDQRYYTGSSKQPGGAVLGVIDGTSVLIETIPQSSGSHSVAADCLNNSIFVPQVAPASVVGSGGDTTTVGEGICGGTNGCVAVYTHPTSTLERSCLGNNAYFQ